MKTFEFASANKLKPWNNGQQQNASVPKELLQVDHTYQRDGREDSETVKDITKKFDLRIIGVLLVARRPDGSLFIMCGQGRWLAAMGREDVKTLDCKIFDLDSVEEEAEIYKKEAKRTPMKAIEIYKADLVRREPYAVALDKCMTLHGYTLVRSRSEKQRTTACVAELRDAFKRDADLAANVFDLAAQITDEGAIDSRLYLGLFQLERCFIESQCGESIFSKKTRGILIEAGQEHILKKIYSAKESELLSGTDNGRICAAGVLCCINDRRRGDNKISPAILYSLTAKGRAKLLVAA